MEEGENIKGISGEQDQGVGQEKVKNIFSEFLKGNNNLEIIKATEKDEKAMGCKLGYISGISYTKALNYMRENSVLGLIQIDEMDGAAVDSRDFYLIKSKAPIRPDNWYKSVCEFDKTDVSQQLKDYARDKQAVALGDIIPTFISGKTIFEEGKDRERKLTEGEPIEDFKFPLPEELRTRLTKAQEELNGALEEIDNFEKTEETKIIDDIRQKKETEAKAKVEKKAAEEKAKIEKKLAEDKERLEDEGIGSGI